MMRKCLSLILLLLIPYFAFAQMRSKDELYVIAQKLLRGDSENTEFIKEGSFCMDRSKKVKVLCSYNRGKTLNNKSNPETNIEGTDTLTEFYVFGREDGTPGYAILSANQQTHPVLAFSLDEYIDVDGLPEAMAELLEIYALRSENGDFTSGHLSHPLIHKVSANESIAPLLGGIKFNQGTPYNDLCPTYNGEKCLLGCWPTAMAEVMTYYKYPICMNSSYGDISYTTETKGISTSWNCSNTIFDWGNICDTYTSYAPITQVSTDNRNLLSFLGFEHSDRNDEITLKYITNISGSTFSGDLRLLLADKHGNFITTAGDAIKIENFKNRYLYQKMNIDITVPRSIADGEYRIYLAAKSQEAQNWSVVRRAKSESADDRYDTSTFTEAYIVVRKSGNTFFYDDQLFSCGYTEEQGYAISVLCGACAHAAQADFGVASTPTVAIDAIEGLVTYMNYSSEIRYMEPEYFQPDQWHLYIQEELNESRPIFIAGTSASGSHAFIIDGYQYIDGIPYYHVNWGWNGHSNGYFLLDYLKPSEAGDGGYEKNYGEHIRVVSHVMPSNNENFTNQLVCLSITLDNTDYNVGDKIQINIKDLSNRTFRTIEERELRAYLVDESGTDYPLGKIMDIKELKFLYSYRELNRSIKIPSTVPTGNFMLDLRLIESDPTKYSHVQSPSTVRLKINNNTSCRGIYSDGQFTDKSYDLSGRGTNVSLFERIVISQGKKILK